MKHHRSAVNASYVKIRWTKTLMPSFYYNSSLSPLQASKPSPYSTERQSPDSP